MKRRFGHRAPFRAERHPAAPAHRADQRQVVAPVHRPGLHVFFAARDPGVRAAHRDVGAGFIEEDQPVDDRCRRTHFRNAARFSATSGRSISLGRGRFF